MSYVINDGPRPVAPATRERVLAAIDETGYTPNRTARALRTRRTGQIGLIVPSITAALFGELAAAVEAAAFERDVLTHTGNSEYDRKRELDYANAFLTAGVDGLIVASVGATGIGGLAESVSVPVVYVNRRPSRSVGLLVDVNNESAAAAGVKHLIDHGLDTVACITGINPVGPVRLRERGWRSALSNAGIDPGKQHVFRTAYRREAVHDALMPWLRSLSSTPVGVFVATDEQAIGLIAAGATEGIQSPRDLRVVAFDGTSASAYTTPTLTTVEMPIRQMALSAVEGILNDDGTRRSPRLRLETRLRIGRSCGCPLPAP